MSASAANVQQTAKRCAILMPVGNHLDPRIDAAVAELGRRGYATFKSYGGSAIDSVRNRMATNALAEGFEETFWIDSDVLFHPDRVDIIRTHELPLCSGLYAQKGRPAFASQFLPGTSELSFGTKGGLVEILYAAAGFLHVRREVYETVQRVAELPVCNARFGKPVVPYFLPMIIPDEDAHEASPDAQWYLPEDFSFSERVRRAGYKVMADTSLRLGHIGNYEYGWEDVGAPRTRSSAGTFRMGGAP